MPEVVAVADAQWPSAEVLLVEQCRVDRRNLALLGVPTFESSLTPRAGGLTPVAVRRALRRYSTWSYEDQIDLAEHAVIVDYGDVSLPDQPEGRRRLREAILRIEPRCDPILVVGGDNALTFPVLSFLSSGQLGQWGLITLDAHLDLRDGSSNGSPVRELLDAGLSPTRTVQVGLADFSNSAPYARRAAARGLHAIPRSRLRDGHLHEALDEALAVAGAGGGPIYVDVDLDVVDRSEVPACPAAAPGGLSADDLRQSVRHLAAHPQVRALDFTEVDADRDVDDERTVRLLALCLLEAVAGSLRRPT